MSSFTCRCWSRTPPGRGMCTRTLRGRYENAMQLDFEAGNDEKYEVDGIRGSAVQCKEFGTARFLQRSQKPATSRRSASRVQLQLQSFHRYWVGSGDGKDKLPGLRCLDFDVQTEARRVMRDLAKGENKKSTWEPASAVRHLRKLVSTFSQQVDSNFSSHRRRTSDGATHPSSTHPSYDTWTPTPRRQVPPPLPSKPRLLVARTINYQLIIDTQSLLAVWWRSVWLSSRSNVCRGRGGGLRLEWCNSTYHCPQRWIAIGVV